MLFSPLVFDNKIRVRTKCLVMTPRGYRLKVIYLLITSDCWLPLYVLSGINHTPVTIHEKLLIQASKSGLYIRLATRIIYWVC